MSLGFIPRHGETDKTKASLVAQGVPRVMGSIPGLGRSPEEGNGYPLQYYSLGNPMDRGVWQATVHGLQRAGHN